MKTGGKVEGLAFEFARCTVLCGLAAATGLSLPAAAEELSSALVPAPRKMVELGGFTTSTNVTFVTDSSVPHEGYRLTVSQDGTRVVSSDAAGAFYATQTLEQLRENGRCPLVEIEDAPAYRWRGVHIDDCRHFFGKQTLRRVLELMSRHKMNVLHWHLTEDQGWRLEIPGYPNLVRYGAVRPESPTHRPSLTGAVPPSEGMEMDGMRYGPFYYTESDVKEILAFAAARQIVVVPEIELPGHINAALAAYPEFACRPENLVHRHPRLVWGIEEDVLCLGNDKAIRFMEDVLDYVCRLFPSEFIHIGGDECPTVRWKECPKCQARIKAEGLKDEKGLQPWISRHFARFLERRGKRAIGWHEYLSADLPSGAAVMDWHAGTPNDPQGEAVAKSGRDIVMSPFDFTYFYYGQGLRGDPFEYGREKVLPLEKVYRFDPCAGMPRESRKHVLGGQCFNWSEFTWNEYDLEWKMWPRCCAMAEVLWLGDAKPGFPDFRRRMIRHRDRLLGDGVNCAPLE